MLPDVFAVDLAAAGRVNRAERVPEALDAGGTGVDDASSLPPPPPHTRAKRERRKKESVGY